jgi:hypothetical protein
LRSCSDCALAAIKNEAIKGTESVLGDAPYQAIFAAALLAELSEN